MQSKSPRKQPRTHEVPGFAITRRVEIGTVLLDNTGDRHPVDVAFAFIAKDVVDSAGMSHPESDVLEYDFPFMGFNHSVKVALTQMDEK